MKSWMKRYIGWGLGGSWAQECSYHLGNYKDFRCSMPGTGEGNGNPLQYSCLENPMDGGAWWAAVHGVAKSQIWLSNFTFTSHFHALEKEMATHSSVLAWRIPGTGEPGGLPSMGLHRVGHDWSGSAAAVVFSLCNLGYEVKQIISKFGSTFNILFLAFIMSWNISEFF